MTHGTPAVDWRQDMWTRAINSFGTGYIFERRARDLQRRTTMLAFLGIALPLSVGGLYLSPAKDEPWFAALTFLVGVASVFQLLGSTWSMVSHWNVALAYAHESATHNARLARAFENLAKENPSDYQLRAQILNAEYDGREQQDLKQTVSEGDRRRGMRAALRQYQHRCSACGLVPTSMKASDCGVCGNF